MTVKMQAFQQAQETGQIAITERTARFLMAIEKFENAADDLVTAFNENLPAEMDDIDLCNSLSDGFYNLFRPLQDYVYTTVGGIMFKSLFWYQFTNKFEGL